MKYAPQSIDGLFLITPDVFEDDRGAFRRNFCANELRGLGIEMLVCQGNISDNTHAYTMRGFHFQKSPSRESKLLTPVSGGLFNVVIDLRPLSATFLKYVPLEVKASRRQSVLVPAGCANAFLTIEPNTVVQYYMGDFFKPETYAGFRFDDPFFSIPWPHEPTVISERDAAFPAFSLDQL